VQARVGVGFLDLGQRGGQEGGVGRAAGRVLGEQVQDEPVEHGGYAGAQ